jgi:TetR/AcrR family transcriptional regulator, mexCD-oprJ operon repressor
VAPAPSSRDTGPLAEGKRADARRNVAAILEAATTCLMSDPDASIGEIARAAGVGRVTLYGHFGSRAELVEAVFARTLAQAEQALTSVDVTGDARDALTRLVHSTWRIIAGFRALLAAAERELPPERVRAHHRKPLERVQALIARGRSDGVFRSDLPVSWLTATFYGLLHTAADEITAGRLSADDAARQITATLLAAYAPPRS